MNIVQKVSKTEYFPSVLTRKIQQFNKKDAGFSLLENSEQKHKNILN